VWNDEVRWTTKQLLSKYNVSLFGHTAKMPYKPDAKKTLIASPGCPCTTWIKTIQQNLKSNNLSLNEAIDVAQNHVF